MIGQSDYTGLPKLANPHNDAEAMAGLLGRLGFAVTAAYDGDRAALSATLSSFEASAKNTDVALVYYSGHGIEAGGENYLAPTDADLTTPKRAGETLVPVSAMLAELAKTVQVTIVLLDACRSNAFPDGTAIQPPGVAAPIPAASTGLGELRGPTPVGKPGVPASNLGMVIGFAAAPGQPALDGAPGEANSPYAAALLKHLSASGYSFGDVMTFVSNEVYLRTGGKQQPWSNVSLHRFLTFGQPVDQATGDEAAIVAGHRALLLSITDVPDTMQATLRTLAVSSGVPLVQVYAMLKSLGTDLSDPAGAEQELQRGAERIRAMLADTASLDVDDAELKSLVVLAGEATTEGAYDEALDLWDRAAARAESISDRLAADADDQHRALARIFASAGDVAFAAFDYGKAAGRYEAASAEIGGVDAGLSNTYKTRQAEALTSLGEFGGDTAKLFDGLTLYNDVMTYLDEQDDDDAWADTYNEFGYALSVYGDRQQSTEFLEDAEHAFEQVAGIWTKDKRPVDWARVQNNLGNVYASLGDRANDPQRWQQARSAYGDALSVWTETAKPLEWARAQNNLGTVLRSLGTYGKDSGELSKAVQAYRAALRQWTLEAAPYDYAVAQNNLGNALTDLAKYVKPERNHADGLAAYDAALTVWSKERQPLQWAAVQNNIGATYATMGREEDGTASLEKAVDAYAQCLGVRTRDNDPRNWALTQYNLGLVQVDLADRTKDASDWQAAVDAFSAALEIYDADNSPADWADAQEYLGWAEANLGAATHDRDLIEQGREAVQSAYDYYRDQSGADDYYQDKLSAIDALLKSVS